MGLFGSLFGKKKSSGLPPELSQLFDKIAAIMEDENMQNSMNQIKKLGYIKSQYYMRYI